MLSYHNSYGGGRASYHITKWLSNLPSLTQITLDFASKSELFNDTARYKPLSNKELHRFTKAIHKLHSLKQARFSFNGYKILSQSHFSHLNDSCQKITSEALGTLSKSLNRLPLLQNLGIFNTPLSDMHFPRPGNDNAASLLKFNQNLRPRSSLKTLHWTLTQIQEPQLLLYSPLNNLIQQLASNQT